MVPVNLVPPTRPHLKAIGSTRSQQTQPTVATCTKPYCLNPRNAIKQTNTCTRLNLPGLSKPNATQSKQGPQTIMNSHDNPVTQGSPLKIKTPQYPARMDKVVPIINHSKGRSNQKSTTQPSIMDYISKGRKRLHVVQLTTPDNNKK